MTEPRVDQAAEALVAGRASRAFGWSFGNTVVSRLGTLAIGIVLARVLGPDEFGVFAIALIALMAVLSFNELGVSLAVIRWRDAPETIAPTVNTIAALSSALLTAAMVFGAPWVATMLGDAKATPVIQVLAVSILINGLVSTSGAVLQREFMQKQRTIADQVNTWLGAGLSLLFAFLGWGAMSLALGRLIASVVFGIMLVSWSPIPYRFGWNRAIVARLFRFGLPLAAASIVVFASSYTDQIIVGSMLGAQALGFYVLAFNLSSWPVSIFSQPLRAVAPAAFSALKGDPDRMARSFSRVLAILSCVAIPVCLAISGAADPIVTFVYGPAWLPAAAVLVWLAAAAALRIWFELGYDYLVVQGKSGIVLLIQACMLAVSLPLMLLAVHPFGEAGVAAVQLFVAAAVGVPLYLLGLRRAGIRVRSLLVAVALPSAAGIAVWLGAWASGQLIPVPLLAGVAAAGLAVAVAAALAWRHRGDLARLRNAAAARRVAP